VSLNVKNPRAYALATQLSEITGESLTDTVIRSLEVRLTEEQQKRTGRDTATRMLEFAGRFAVGIKPGVSSLDHANLYGEDGLPH
jgi:antitoxin VapB